MGIPDRFYHHHVEKSSRGGKIEDNNTIFFPPLKDHQQVRLQKVRHLLRVATSFISSTYYYYVRHETKYERAIECFRNGPTVAHSPFMAVTAQHHGHVACSTVFYVRTSCSGPNQGTQIMYLLLQQTPTFYSGFPHISARLPVAT